MKIESGHWKTRKIFGMVLFRNLFFVQICGYAVWVYSDRVVVKRDVYPKKGVNIEGVTKL